MLGVIGDDMEAELVDTTMDVPLFKARRDSLPNANVEWILSISFYAACYFI